MKNSEIINNHFTLTYLLERSGNESIFKDFGLSVQTYSLLSAIHSGIHEIPILKASTNNSGANLAQKIKKLEGLGFISRELDSKDSRRRHIYITDLGKKTYKQIHKKYHTIADPLFAGISEKKKKHYTEVVEILIQRLSH